MNENTRYMLRLWGIVLFFVTLLLVGFGGAIMRGEYLKACLLGALFLLVLCSSWYRKRKMAALLFRHTTPDQAVAYFRAKMTKSPKNRAALAYMNGLILAFYGEFDEARDELATVSWSSLPPMYQGFRTNVLAVIAILQEDYRKAAELAAEGRDLIHTNIAFPGSKVSRRSADALVDSIDLLTGNGTDATLTRVEDSVRTLPSPMAKLIPALALARYYNQKGNMELAAVYDAILVKIAPHCTILRAKMSI